MNRLYFIIGIILFYFIIFFAPNRNIFFIAYFISTLFFYISSKNIRLSLLYSLVLTLFFGIGYAGSYFIIEPSELNQSVGWQIMPMTLIIFCLLILSYNIKINKIYLADYFILLFFIICVINIIFFANFNVFIGITSLSEILLIYYIFRIYLNKKNLSELSFLLISMVIFQTIIGLFQLLLRQPIGILIDTDVNSMIYGYTAIEEDSLFRIAGTFIHPNFMASFLLTFIPFLLFYNNRNKSLMMFAGLTLIILFFTYSRTAWLIFIFIILLINKEKFKKLSMKLISLQKLFTFSLIGVLLVILLSPYLFVRSNTFIQAFEEGGSINIRWKLWQEGINLVTQYPLTGIGLNQSLGAYAADPATDLFQYAVPSISSKIHNMFLEIASEVGVPGVLLFVLFLFFVFKQYFSQRNDSIKKAAFYGLLGLLGMSLMNPFFHVPQFRLIFLLSAIILV